MGECANYGRERVKIGTCEDMYYLRADQAHLVQPLAGNVNPMSEEHRKTIRFRFPWPDEDGVGPGGLGFSRYDRTLPVRVPVPDDVKHYRVQFSAPPGYLVMLPCPEEEEGPESDHGLTFHRNGFGGPSKIVQQAYRNGNLALICECAGCGSKYSLPTLEDAMPYVEALKDLVAGRTDSAAQHYIKIADRIVAGYEPQA